MIVPHLSLYSMFAIRTGQGGSRLEGAQVKVLYWLIYSLVFVTSAWLLVLPRRGAGCRSRTKLRVIPLPRTSVVHEHVPSSDSYL